jgi:hypothetical protein
MMRDVVLFAAARVEQAARLAYWNLVAPGPSFAEIADAACAEGLCARVVCSVQTTPRHLLPWQPYLAEQREWETSPARRQPHRVSG